jgi:hypothetical protein
MERKHLLDTLMVAIDNALANMHTATIAKVTAVGATTINCRPVTNRLVNGKSIALPEFIEVPPLFLQGGGSYTAHPIAVGDYCLLIFTERCFDRWYHGQDFQPPLELRMHDYSDGVAIVGLNPLAGAITIPTVIQQTGDTNQDGEYTHQGTMTRTGDLVITGNIVCTGSISATEQITAGTVSLSSHIHGGVTTGSGNTGGPT